MLSYFLTVAIRHIFRNKVYSFIHVVGLAVGTVGFILILDYVRPERSYDDFHDHANEIYRVQLDQYKDNQLIFKSSENYPAVGPTLVRELPEVVDFARLYNLGSKNNVIITYRETPGGPIGVQTSFTSIQRTKEIAVRKVAGEGEIHRLQVCAKIESTGQFYFPCPCCRSR